MIFDDNTFCKFNKLNKKIKDEWIGKFIKNENFICQILQKLSEITITENNEINQAEIIKIIINWFLSLFNKISEKNKNIINLINEEESESNFNILEENKIENKLKKNEISSKADNSNKNGDEEDFGQYEIDDLQTNNFIKILENNKFVCYIIL